VNDFIFSEAEKGIAKKHFLIRYSAIENSYLLTDLGQGTGTFVKINPEWILEDSMLICFGEVHFITLIKYPNPDKEGKINSPY